MSWPRWKGSQSTCRSELVASSARASSSWRHWAGPNRGVDRKQSTIGPPDPRQASGGRDQTGSLPSWQVPPQRRTWAAEAGSRQLLAVTRGKASRTSSRLRRRRRGPRPWPQSSTGLPLKRAAPISTK